MGYIILDLDNCISNDEWRIPHIRWKESDLELRYQKYHALSPFDDVGNPDLIVMARNPIHTAIIFTARPETQRDATEEWLRRKNIPWAMLSMRGNGRHYPSAELKFSQLMDLTHLGIHPFQDIICAYDDRQDVIDMYHGVGVPAERRFIHDICSWTGEGVGDAQRRG